MLLFGYKKNPDRGGVDPVISGFTRDVSTTEPLSTV